MAVIAVVSTRPRSMPLAMITIRKPIHEFLFFSLYEYGAPLGDPSHYNVIMFTVKIQMYTRRTFATEDDIGMSKHVARLGNTAEGNGYQSISVTEEELTASLATSVQKFVTLNSKFFIITFQANEFTDSRYLSPLIRML